MEKERFDELMRQYAEWLAVYYRVEVDAMNVKAATISGGDVTDAIITSEWLRIMHPELDEEEAEEYRLFCRANTITWQGCYGRGEIMWPRWQAFKASIQTL